MMHQTWQLADRNVQYRIFNAIIKEQIFPENMFLTSMSILLNCKFMAKC